MTRKTKSEAFDFEAALKELETIVERMELGEQTLEASLSDFERGMELSRSCQQSLKQAEQRIEILMQKHGDTVGDTAIESFVPDADA